MPSKSLDDFKRLEQQAESLIPLIGHLYRERNIVTMVFGERLVNISVHEIIEAHRDTATRFKSNANLGSTLALLQAVASMPLGVKALRFDVGRMAELCADALAMPSAIRASVLSTKLKELGIEEVAASVPSDTVARSVVLYGFGRIGRLLARLLTEKIGDGNKLMLRAIVVRKSAIEDIRKRASLLMKDSVHGLASFTVDVDEESNTLILNGNPVKLLYSHGPDKMDYTSHGWSDIIIIDNTGKWRDDEGLGLHLQSPGVSKVLLTAPAKGDVTNVVVGVNDGDQDFSAKPIWSAASCTTNAIAPVLSLMESAFGIVSGHIETVHSYTNDQNLIDNFHYKARRGRAAPLNLVLTETGAGKAVVKCIPSLTGKLTASAIRVPTPNVSMAMIMLNTERDIGGKAELNNFLRHNAAAGKVHLQLGYSADEEAVSCDFVGNRHSGIVDANATICEGKRCNLYLWYDNEFGYSCQVVRLVQKIAGIQHPSFPRADQIDKVRSDSFTSDAGGT